MLRNKKKIVNFKSYKILVFFFSIKANLISFIIEFLSISLLISLASSYNRTNCYFDLWLSDQFSRAL